jgi:predicted NACHT family NTPase
MQTFLLRQLYAPLRVTVEAAAGREWTAEAISELEQRRDRRRLAEAGRDAREEESNKRFSLGERLNPQARQPAGKKPGRKRKPARATSVPPPLAPRLVVLGDPGGGKTTLLRWLATAYLLRRAGDPEFTLLPDANLLPQAHWLPVLVRCRDLDKARVGQCRLEDVLRQALQKLELPVSQVEPLIELLRKLLERGEALLLVDGLDEITDPKLRAAFCGWIERAARLFPTAPIVATSRIVGYREMKRRLGAGFEHVTLADLSPEDKDTFIDRWCDVTIPEAPRRTAEADKLKQGIHGSDESNGSRATR